KDRLIAMQCRVIFFVPKPGQPDQSLAAPWDKLYRRAFLEKNHLRFPERLKVLEDMSFNFHVFGRAERIGYLHRRLYHYIFLTQSITHAYRADRHAEDCRVYRHLRRCIEEQERRERPGDASAWQRHRRKLTMALYGRMGKSTAVEIKSLALAAIDRMKEKRA
ncbi:MAG: hypothetical protein K6G16_06885, partial [Lachnospiraceae bacterium]|nr:hypothetical protein [Lachnospiraceae bacterium]